MLAGAIIVFTGVLIPFKESYKRIDLDDGVEPSDAEPINSALPHSVNVSERDRDRRH